MKKTNVPYLSLVAFLALNVNIQANEVIDLEKIDVVGKSPSVTEDSNSYTTKSMNTSTKLDLSIKETPQHVNVVTVKELENKNIDTVDDVLRNTPGVGFINMGTGLTPYSRGFRIRSTKIDGSMNYTDISNPDMAIYDRVEIVRGANGLTSGEGEPSLKMNFVRKHANSKELTGSITLDAGSWNSYGQTTDISTPLTEDKKTRARVIVKNTTADFFYDNKELKNNVYYGIIDGEINDQISYSLGASYQEENTNGVWDWGLPTFYDDWSLINLPRSTSFAKDWTYRDTTTKDIFGSYKHYLTDDINLNISASYKKMKDDTHQLMLWHSWNPTIDRTTNIMSGTIDQYKGVSNYKEKNLDINLNIPFEIADLSHELVIGATYNKHDQKKDAVIDYEDNVNPFTYDGQNLIPNNLPNNVYQYREGYDATTQTAAYLAGKFSLSQKLKLIAGLRVSTWEYNQNETRFNPGSDRTSNSEDDREFNNILTPYAGLVYDLNKNHSLFVSYTDIFQPQDDKDINENYIDPIVGKNYETGIKSEFFDGKLNSTLSVYRIIQDNIAERIEPRIELAGGGYAYRALEGVVSKGVELTFAGQLTDNLDATFGISNFEAKDADGEHYNTSQARTTANIFLNYKLNKDLELGLGARYYSKVWANEGRENLFVEQKPYTLVDLMSSYRINKNASVQLNLKNLFDKNYYEGVNAFHGMVYGEPRSFNASFKYKF